MKFQLTISNSLKIPYCNEISQYQKNLDTACWQAAWHHMERAHILAQPFAWEHSQVNKFPSYIRLQ